MAYEVYTSSVLRESADATGVSPDLNGPLRRQHSYIVYYAFD
jgi:hypothetical protein